MFGMFPSEMVGATCSTLQPVALPGGKQNLPKSPPLGVTEGQTAESFHQFVVHVPTHQEAHTALP